MRFHGVRGHAPRALMNTLFFNADRGGGRRTRQGVNVPPVRSAGRQCPSASTCSHRSPTTEVRPTFVVSLRLAASIN